MIENSEIVIGDKITLGHRHVIHYSTVFGYRKVNGMETCILI